MSGIPVFQDWLDVSVPWHGAVVPLGNFDGVHRGHQVLIGQAAGFAQALDAPVVALTFEPHPRTFFVKDTAPFRLTSPATKTRLLAHYGVQAVLAQRFDPDFAAVAAEDFVDGILVAGLRARHVVCGYDFTFGARRSGNVDMLQRMGADRGFAVTVVPPVMREGEIYSSTRIREALRAGMAREAADLLGHSWEIEGIVEQGDQRGRRCSPSATLAVGKPMVRPRWSPSSTVPSISQGWPISSAASLTMPARNASRMRVEE
jgi:riboflavin kinase/FMN adenylyltransferase